MSTRAAQLAAAWAAERQMLLGGGTAPEIAAAVDRADQAIAGLVWFAGPEFERRLAAAEDARREALQSGEPE